MANAPVEIKKAGAPEKPRSDAWRSFRHEMDSLFDRFSGRFGLAPWRHRAALEPMFRYESSFDVTLPAVDVSEDAAGYQVTAELPGLTEKDVEVKLTDDMLTIRGEKRQEKEQKDGNFHVSERAYGAFERSFTLPDDVDRDKIAANVGKGVLTVTLPKKPGAKPNAKSIEVKAGT